ncbi:MAG: hypothetical protein NVSMB27_38600 [Ktedonobacteraceae bacterium]
MTSENNPMREQQNQTNEQRRPAGEGQGKFRFGNYDLVRRIDVGGMGEVYLARQRTAFDREVAIKIIRSDLVHDTTARKRFLREAEVNAHIKHEHILPLFEFGEEQGRLFLVTPYIAGGTLLRRLQTGPLSLAEVYQLFTALVEAVAYIHRRGVIHRDLKPSNVLLDQEGNTGQIYVRLIDFGIASIQGMAASPPLTTAGTEVGTVAYMAPERLSGIAAPSNDIYSLGIILYQMLTGQLPSAEDGQRRLSLPQPLEYVVNHCVDVQPQDRFANADELLKAFEYTYQYLNTPTSTTQKPPPKPAPALPVRPIIHMPQGDAIMPNRASTPPPGGSFKQEIKTLPPSDEQGSWDAIDRVPPPSKWDGINRVPPPSKPKGFGREDYESPTVDISLPGLKSQQGSTPPPSAVVKPPRTPGRNPLLAIMTLLVVFVLLAAAGLFFFEFSPALAATANVNFGPQVQPIKQIFHIKGSVSQTNIDVNAQSIPVKSLTSTKDGSLSGPTSQQCIFGIFNCQYVVQQQDVDTLSIQLSQSLDRSINQTLQQQMQSLGGVRIGDVQYTDATPVAEPPIGSDSKTVRVTISGQKGQLAYISNADAKVLARLLLKQEAQKLGTNYMLISSTVAIGQPVIQGLDAANGVVRIDIAAAGDAEYQFPAAQLRSIQSAIKGLKLKDAISFLKRQQGVDANSVNIHLSAGDTMPGDVQQIRMIPINPANIPAVFLPQVTPVLTSTPNG